MISNMWAILPIRCFILLPRVDLVRTFRFPSVIPHGSLVGSAFQN